MREGKLIVLTAPLTETIDHAGYFIQMALASLPIAAYRARHKLPEINTELYEYAMKNYKSQYPPGVFSNFLPENLDETSNYLKTKTRW